MLNTTARPWLAGFVWLATVVGILGCSVMMDARWSTSGLLLLVGLTPAIVVLIIGAGAPAPTVAEILHSVHGRDGR